MPPHGKEPRLRILRTDDARAEKSDPCADGVGIPLPVDRDAGSRVLGGKRPRLRLPTGPRRKRKRRVASLAPAQQATTSSGADGTTAADTATAPTVPAAAACADGALASTKALVRRRRSTPRQRRKQNPLWPKKALSAYSYFLKRQRPAVQTDLGPGSTVQAIVREVARRWQVLEPEHRQEYDALAAKDKIRHEAEASSAKLSGVVQWLPVSPRRGKCKSADLGQGDGGRGEKGPWAAAPPPPSTAGQECKPGRAKKAAVVTAEDARLLRLRAAIASAHAAAAQCKDGAGAKAWRLPPGPGVPPACVELLVRRLSTLEDQVVLERCLRSFYAKVNASQLPRAAVVAREWSTEPLDLDEALWVKYGAGLASTLDVAAFLPPRTSAPLAAIVRAVKALVAYPPLDSSDASAVALSETRPRTHAPVLATLLRWVQDEIKATEPPPPDESAVAESASAAAAVSGKRTTRELRPAAVQVRRGGRAGAARPVVHDPSDDDESESESESESDTEYDIHRCLDNQTPHQVSAIFDVDVAALLALNRHRYPTIRAHSRLKPGTSLLLPLDEEEQKKASGHAKATKRGKKKKKKKKKTRALKHTHDDDDDGNSGAPRPSPLSQHRRLVRGLNLCEPSVSAAPKVTIIADEDLDDDAARKERQAFAAIFADDEDVTSGE